MNFLIIIIISLVILDIIISYLKGPHLLKERIISSDDYKTIHKNNENTVLSCFSLEQ